MNINNNTLNPLEAIEKRIKDLTGEREEIIKVCSRLTQFIQENALNPVNDDILVYIEHFIQEEQTKKNRGAQNDGVIEGLKKLLADYENEMKIFEEGRKRNCTTPDNDLSMENKTLELEEIFLLVGKLYRLPINGAKICAQVDEMRRVQQKFIQNREKKINLPVTANSSLIMTDLKNIFTEK